MGLPRGALGRRRLGGRQPSPAGYITGTIVWAKRATMAEGARLASGKGRSAMMDVDVVALEVGPDPLIEALAQRTTAVHEPVDGQRAIVGRVQAVDVALVEPGHVQRGLSHRFGGNSGDGQDGSPRDTLRWSNSASQVGAR